MADQQGPEDEEEPAKRLWGFDKVRYRGLAKNATRAFVTLAMDNIYLARQPLLAQVRA